MRFAVLIGATVWAMSAPLSKRENLYFYAQILYLVVTEIFLLLGGDRSLAYGLSYEILTAIILSTVALVTWENKPRLLILVIGTCASLVVFLRAYEELTKPLRYFSWGYLFEGSILIGCGFMLVFCYVEKKIKQHTVITIGLLWILLGLFRLGFVLQITSPLWLHLNWVIPSWLVTAAFILVGVYGRKDHRRLVNVDV